MQLNRGNRRYHNASEPERFVLQNEKIIFLEKKLRAILEPITLTWLEAAVFVHYYWGYHPIEKVADILEKPVTEVEKARLSLLAQVAAAQRLAGVM